jgi:hypothetical protein
LLNTQHAAANGLAGRVARPFVDGGRHRYRRLLTVAVTVIAVW